MPEARIYALASPVGSDVRHAEDLYRAGKVDEALVLLDKARAAAPPQALPYFDQRLAAGRIEADIAAGRPATLFSARTLAGWTPVNGTWTVESDGALIVTSDARGHLIIGDARVGSDIEISADIEVASTSNGQCQAGIVLGRDIEIWTHGWLSFRVKKTAHEGAVAYFSQNFFQPARSIPHPVGLESHVVVQSWAGHLSEYVDGKPVVTDYVPEWRMTRSGDAQVGFGAYVNDNTIVVRYRNVGLRRLSAPPECAVPALPRTADAELHVFGPGWFHEGATKRTGGNGRNQSALPDNRRAGAGPRSAARGTGLERRYGWRGGSAQGNPAYAAAVALLVMLAIALYRLRDSRPR